MKNISGYLTEKYKPWGWMGQRAHDAEGINRVLPLDFIISCDYGTDTPLYFDKDDVFSIEKKRKIRKNWSNEHLNSSLKGALGREIFDRWNGYDRPVNLICYRSVRKLEADQEALSWNPNIHAAPEYLKRHFDNKIRLCKKLAGSDIPAIPCVVGRLGDVDFGDIRGELSLPFVIQLPYGSSGSGTFLVREENEFELLSRKHKGRLVSIRRYIDGFSLNVNGIILSTEDGPATYCSFPSVQIVGIPECSDSPTAFCGNDYTSARSIDKGLVEQVEHGVKTIGSWMGKAGFRGIFGMDFVVGGGKVYPVEINPRFQNSTALFTAMEEERSSPGHFLFLLHIAEFLQKDDIRMRKYVKDFPKEDLMIPAKGSQVILHNRDSDHVVTGHFRPGIYRLNGKDLCFVRESASLSDCRGQDDVLVTCAVPEPYTRVESGAPLCKMQMRGNAMDPAGRRSVTERAGSILSQIYNGLKLKEADEAQVAGPIK